MDTTRMGMKGKSGRLRKSIGQQEVCFNGFLDAEYSVILGYGFLQLAQLFDSIRKSLKIADILNPKAWSSVGEATILNGDFVWSLVTSLFLIVMFVMLVDDYYRARMICKNIPIKSGLSRSWWRFENESDSSPALGSQGPALRARFARP